MVYSTRQFVLCLTLRYFVLVFLSPFSIAITSLGEERARILVLFVRLFDLRLFGFVCFLFLFVSGKFCDFDCGIPWLFLFPFYCLISNQNKVFTLHFVSFFMDRHFNISEHAKWVRITMFCQRNG